MSAETSEERDEDPAYRFEPASLAAARRPGIGAFMRVRNGEDFVALAIESHLPYLDEIVVCHNRCTDGTVAILERLAARYPDKLRVHDYAPRVHPAGSDGHRRTSWRSVHSLANYYNFALARTTCSVVMKLDDDHVAIGESVARITEEIRAANCRLDGRMACFSGINLIRADDRLGPLAYRTFAGHGDHWYFEVGPETFFTKDRRFERLERGRLVREYRGLAYWHLKYLKRGEGFDNYELDANPASRYHRQLAAYRRGRRVIGFDELETRCRADVRRGANPLRRLLRRVDDKRRLKFERARRFDADETRRWLSDAAPTIEARVLANRADAPANVDPNGTTAATGTGRG